MKPNDQIPTDMEQVISSPKNGEQDAERASNGEKPGYRLTWIHIVAIFIACIGILIVAALLMRALRYGGI